MDDFDSSSMLSLSREDHLIAWDVLTKILEKRKVS